MCISLRSKPVVVVALVFVLLVTAVSPTLASNEPDAPHQSGYYHLISYGETLSRIAFAYGVPIQAILDANPHVTNPNLIYYGTYIFVPHSINPPYTYPPYGCRVDHVVNVRQVFSVEAVDRHGSVEPQGVEIGTRLPNGAGILVQPVHQKTLILPQRGRPPAVPTAEMNDETAGDPRLPEHLSGRLAVADGGQ